MRHAAFLILIFSLCACSDEAESVCAAEETIVWSCGKQESTYVVCASKDLSQDSGYLQYRAEEGGKSVLTFPASRIHPVGLFEFHLLPRGAVLSFENGGYLYKMIEGLEGAPSIAVSQAEKHLITVQCTDSDHTLTLTNTINLLKAAGLGE